MAVKFSLYSIDIAATLNPWDADPAPAVMIDLGEDPIFGDYNPNGGARKRGSRIATLGGAVDQDFGPNEKDGRITLAVRDSHIPAATMSALDAAYLAVDTEYYFTDSLQCWKVKFESAGFKKWQNLFWKSAKNEDVFTYELALKVQTKAI